MGIKIKVRLSGHDFYFEAFVKGRMMNLRNSLFLLTVLLSLTACDDAGAEAEKVFESPEKASAAVELTTMTCWNTGLTALLDKYDAAISIVDENGIFKAMKRQSLRDMTEAKEQAKHAHDMTSEEVLYLVDLGKELARKNLKEPLASDKMDADALTNFGTPTHCAKLLKANYKGN